MYRNFTRLAKANNHQLANSRQTHFTIIFCIILLFICKLKCIDSCNSFKKETRIKLEKNGYTNIVIGIEEGVPESRSLIERIKHTFTQASELLFTVTKY